MSTGKALPIVRQIAAALDAAHAAGIVHRDLKTANGALAEARRLLDEALALYRSRGDPSGEGAALFGLGKVFSLQGESEKARSHHQQALAIRQRLGERLGVEESTKALAGLAKDQKDFKGPKGLKGQSN